MRSMMGNEVSAGEDEREDSGSSGEESEQKEASGGLWVLSQELEDGEDVSVFTCTASSQSQAGLCRAGAEHLRLLRHPNILKFLSYDLSQTPISMVTEPVVPVTDTLDEMCVEGVVTGWRGVAQGLSFLHQKAKLSHNSLCCECVYVSANTSQWKIGGFEAASLHSKTDAAFIATIAAIRPPSTVPPEDKSPGSVGHIPCHSRDVWAFGHLMLSTVENAGLEGSMSGSLYSYVQTHMLNSDPALRPTAEAVLSQHWMSNDVTKIAEFLTHLTMKTQSQKDEFFKSLTPRLLSLPSSVVAEHLVPYILTALVMAEPEARRTLWPHLLTPVSSVHPKQSTFDPSHICPIIEKELFISLVLPLLLNLLECHDYHVRMVLLQNLINFAPLCPKDELTNSVLPEVLVGLHDVHDEMVQATLRALADMVTLLGGETVMGTARSNIFADAAPRSSDITVAQVDHSSVSAHTPLPPHTSHSPLPSHTAHTAPPPKPSQEQLRKQRAEKMREKRELQRQKRAAKSKLGVASSTMEEEVTGGVGSHGVTPPTGGHAQYSPSVSHDEEDRENLEEVHTGSGDSLNPLAAPAEQDKQVSDEEWEEFVEDGEGEWGGGWGEEDEEDRESKRESSGEAAVLEPGWSLAGTEGGGREGGQKQSPLTSSGGYRGALKLGGKTRNKEEKEKEKTEEEEGKEVRVKGGGERRKGGSVRGRMSDKDVQRLEEQAAWSREPDFFADMMPTVAKSDPLLQTSSERPLTLQPKAAGGLAALEYQPTGAEEGGWGDDWNDF